MNSQLKIEKILFDSCQYDDMLESYFSEFDFSYTIDDKYIIVAWLFAISIKASSV